MTRRRVLGGMATIAAGVLAGVGCQRGMPKNQITLWHMWEGRRGELFNRLLDRFRENHPDIHVEAQLVATRYYSQKWFAAAGSDSLPDLFVFNSSWLRSGSGLGRAI